MSHHDEESPVYYREIQKNAYLKRIPEETGGSKLRPLGHKKPPLKPMWTLFCVHNGRVPYIEQYPSVDAPCTASHRPLWRACLRTARHVTASVTPRGNEHDFLIHTDSGPLRLLAPDWESMQDWVTTLRSKLQELRILGAGENVYCAAPAPPPARAPARDPTSPLPPTPPHPPQRVPGIEIVTPTPRPLPATVEPTSASEPTPQPPITHSVEPTTSQTLPMEDLEANIDISDWDTTLNLSSLPSMSNVKQSKDNTRRNLKICGQNICLDNSIFDRPNDDQFFSELDGTENPQASPSNVPLDGETDAGQRKPGEAGLSFTRQLSVDAEETGPRGRGSKSSEDRDVLEGGGFKQRLVVGRGSEAGTSHGNEENGEYQSTNITVIQVSNKPPHTAIPILRPETDVFKFDFKHNLAVKPADASETTGFTQNLAVKPGEGEETSYKRNLDVKTSVNAVNVGEKYVNVVNTEAGLNNNYGTVFPDDQAESDYGHLSLTTTVSLTGAPSNDVTQSEGIYERLYQASTSTNIPSPLPLRSIKSHEKSRKSSLPNLDLAAPGSSDANPGINQTYEYLYPGSNPNVATQSGKTTSAHVASNSSLATPSQPTMATQPSNPGRSKISSENVPSVSNTRLNRPQNPRGAYVSSVPVSVANVDVITDAVRSNVERTQSQNADSPRLRDKFIRKENGGKTDVKNESKPVQAKPIWKRGLTELSLLSRLRGIGQGKRPDSPTRPDHGDRNPTAAGKPQPRSRREAGDTTRRRSSSLSNGQPPPLASLRSREAAALQAAQARGAAEPARVPRAHPPLLCDHDGALWVAWWGGCGAWHGGRSGDRLAALRGRAVSSLQQARPLLHAPASKIDILFHRVPLAKIYILNKQREDESIGIKLDNDCSISSVEGGSPAARAGLPPAGVWAVTECNNRPLNLVKGGQDELNRLSACGKEVSVLIQPVALVRKLRATMKANKSLLGLR